MPHANLLIHGLIVKNLINIVSEMANKPFETGGQRILEENLRYL